MLRIIWLNEFSTFKEAKEKIGRWIEIDYNMLYVHSQLGYISPEEFERLYRSPNLALVDQICLQEVA
jgi:putative transposase